MLRAAIASPLKKIKRIALAERSKFVSYTLGRVRTAAELAAMRVHQRRSELKRRFLPDDRIATRQSSRTVGSPVSRPVRLIGCHRMRQEAGQGAPSAATVSVVQARRASVPYMIEANGVVTPLQSVAVTSQVDGIIVSVDFQEGQDVSAGQPLFHVDPRPYQNAYEQAAAVLSRDSASWPVRQPSWIATRSFSRRK